MTFEDSHAKVKEIGDTKRRNKMSNMQRNREGAKSETRGPYFKGLDKIEKIAYDDIPAEIKK